MGRNNEDARNGLERPDIPGFEGTMGMLNNFVSKYTKKPVDPRVFIGDKHVGFQDKEGEYMHFEEDTAAQKHFAAQGYNKGTAGDMLKNSKARIDESVKAAQPDNQKARKASKERTANREEARRQERGE